MTKIVPSVQRIFLSTVALFCLVSLPIISPQRARSQAQDAPQTDPSPAATDEVTPNQTETTPESVESSPATNEATPNSDETISPAAGEESPDTTGGASAPDTTAPADATPTTNPAPAGTSDPALSTPTEATDPPPVRALW